jgi:hypothetical protein
MKPKINLAELTDADHQEINRWLYTSVHKSNKKELKQMKAVAVKYGGSVKVGEWNSMKLPARIVKAHELWREEQSKKAAAAYTAKLKEIKTQAAALTPKEATKAIATEIEKNDVESNEWPSANSVEIEDLERSPILFGTLLNAKDFKKFEVVDEWTDDHECCFGIEAVTDTSVKVMFSEWWVEARIYYSAEKDAASRKKVLKYIQQDIKQGD